MGRVLQVLVLDRSRLADGNLRGVEARVKPSPKKDEAVIVWLNDYAFAYGRVEGIRFVGGTILFDVRVQRKGGALWVRDGVFPDWRQ